MRPTRSLGHHFDQVPVRQSVRDIPAHAQLNDVGVKRAFAVDWVTVNRLRHPTPRQTVSGSLPDVPRCTRAELLHFTLNDHLTVAVDRLHAGLIE